MYDSEYLSKLNFCLRQNRGAMSEREVKYYEMLGASDNQIKNVEQRAVKKGPEAGYEGR